MSGALWDARIRRANELTSYYPFATEGLRFYSQVASFQKCLYEEIQKGLGDSTMISSDRPLRDELDLFLLLPRFSGFLSMIEQIAPVPLAKTAACLAKKGPSGWQQAIENFWYVDSETAALTDDPQSYGGNLSATCSDRLLGWIFLQPYAEYLADYRQTAIVNGTPSTCPLCGSNPIVGVLRPQGDGGKKSLICMLCAHEWAFRRICCPACGEEREPQIAYYRASEIAHVRVDVCDTCHTYLKTVDLTKSGLAIPVVDEIATLPLDLWAQQHGYEKFQVNLLGI